MRKKRWFSGRGWLYAVGFLVLTASLVWTQTAVRSLGNELEQTRSDNAALADQVRSLGGQPVAEGKPGARGDQGSIGPRGIQGPEGPPGVRGKPGPIGITGQSPRCLLEPSKCVGPKGASGSDGKAGADGSQGDTGATGAQGDQGVPGVAGADGADGKPGVDGKDGRGIAKAECQQDGTWLITYTDGATSTTDGPCRVGPPLNSN
jgi:hypothetical protein